MIILMDGFDWRITAPGNVFDIYNYLGNWTKVESASIVSEESRHLGGNSLKNYSNLYKYLSSSQEDTKLTIGFAFKSLDKGLCGITLYTDNVTREVGYIIVNLNLERCEYYTNAGLLLATSSNLFNSSAWNYFELQVIYSNNSSTGYVEWRINGLPVTSTTGQTRYFGDKSVIDGIRFWTSNLGNFYLDDVYILNSASGLTDFLGDVRIDIVLPLEDGSYETFLPSVSGENYQMINDQYIDHSDYIYGSGINAKNTFFFNQLPDEVSTVYAVQLIDYSKKTGSDPRVIYPIIKDSGSGEYQGLSKKILSKSSFAFHDYIFEKNPLTGSGWQPYEIPVTEFGYITTSG